MIACSVHPTCSSDPAAITFGDTNTPRNMKGVKVWRSSELPLMPFIYCKNQLKNGLPGSLLASHPHPFSVWEAATISNQASSHPAPGQYSWSQASPDLCQKPWCKAHLRCRVALAPSQEKCEETTTEADSYHSYQKPIRVAWRPTSKKC